MTIFIILLIIICTKKFIWPNLKLSTQVKFKTYYKHSKKWLTILLLMSPFILLWFMFVSSEPQKQKNIIDLIKDKAILGTIGSFLSTLLGAAIALAGSQYVQKKQLEARNIVFRKNVIYVPIYNDLVGLQKQIKEYPFSGWQITIASWERIISDNRELQMPKYFFDGMESLKKHISDYLTYRNNTWHAIQETVNNVLEQKNDQKCLNQKFGESLIEPVMLRQEVEEHLKKSLTKFTPPNSEPKPINYSELIDNIYSQCDQQLNDLNKMQQQLTKSLYDMIATLTLIITHINHKYENQQTIF